MRNKVVLTMIQSVEKIQKNVSPEEEKELMIKELEVLLEKAKEGTLQSMLACGVISSTSLNEEGEHDGEVRLSMNGNRGVLFSALSEIMKDDDSPVVKILELLVIQKISNLEGLNDEYDEEQDKFETHIQNGECCEQCHQYFHDGKLTPISHEKPVICKDCWNHYDEIDKTKALNAGVAVVQSDVY